MKENRQAAAGGFLQRLYVFLTPTATRMPRGFKFVISTGFTQALNALFLSLNLHLLLTLTEIIFLPISCRSILIYFFMRGDATLGHTPHCDTLAGCAQID